MRNWMDKIFDGMKGYNEFVSAMRQADLPVGLQMQDPVDLTLEDLKQFANAFKRDTNIDIKFTLFTCNECERLHMLVVVGEDE